MAEGWGFLVQYLVAFLNDEFSESAPQLNKDKEEVSHEPIISSRKHSGLHTTVEKSTPRTVPDIWLREEAAPCTAGKYYVFGS